MTSAGGSHRRAFTRYDMYLKHTSRTLVLLPSPRLLTPSPLGSAVHHRSIFLSLPALLTDRRKQANPTSNKPYLPHGISNRNHPLLHFGSTRTPLKSLPVKVLFPHRHHHAADRCEDCFSETLSVRQQCHGLRALYIVQQDRTSGSVGDAPRTRGVSRHGITIQDSRRVRTRVHDRIVLSDLESTVLRGMYLCLRQHQVLGKTDYTKFYPAISHLTFVTRSALATV